MVPSALLRLLRGLRGVRYRSAQGVWGVETEGWTLARVRRDAARDVFRRRGLDVRASMASLIGGGWVTEVDGQLLMLEFERAPEGAGRCAGCGALLGDASLVEHHLACLARKLATPRRPLGGWPTLLPAALGPELEAEVAEAWRAVRAMEAQAMELAEAQAGGRLVEPEPA